MDSETTSELDFLKALRGELARVYHDLSNPLAIVSGNLELVVELEKAGAPVEELLVSLHDANAAIVGFKAPLDGLLAIRSELDRRVKELE